MRAAITAHSSALFLNEVLGSFAGVTGCYGDTRGCSRSFTMKRPIFQKMEREMKFSIAETVAVKSASEL